MRILLVEDSPRVTEAVGAGLQSRGHAVQVAATVREAHEALISMTHFDLAIVDIGLPDGSGLDLCRTVREAGREVPILVLTARNDVGDRVVGLDAGADDYLGKPFSMEELLARMRALGRRGPRWEQSVRRFGSVVVDTDQRTVSIGEARLPLTMREFDIVALLAGRRNRVVTREEILEAVWGDATERAAASLDVLVVRIRKKFAEHGLREVLRTVRQVGYAWEPEPSKNG